MSLELLAGMVFLNFLLLCAVIAYLRTVLHHVTSEARLEHEYVTPIATAHGLVKALEAALEAGGISDEARHTIYRAHEEQLTNALHAARALLPGERHTDGRLLVFGRHG